MLSRPPVSSRCRAMLWMRCSRPHRRTRRRQQALPAGQGENLGGETVDHARCQLGAVSISVLQELQHVAPVQPGTPASLVGRLVGEGRVTVVQDGESRPHGRGASAVRGQYQTATRRVGTGEQAYGSGAPGGHSAAQRCPEPLAGPFAGERGGADLVRPAESGGSRLRSPPPAFRVGRAQIGQQQPGRVDPHRLGEFTGQAPAHAVVVVAGPLLSGRAVRLPHEVGGAGSRVPRVLDPLTPLLHVVVPSRRTTSP
ncbi:hypothetical protein QF034_006118 [Streptomyces africanus]|uniref:Uncharacterized protein n=1 Tax=Streptomyces africanus TaxID=231024 RepID=A0ABU0QZQ8_9ACTN|nr:hypothetical protein [Streptomyces africanus]